MLIASAVSQFQVRSDFHVDSKFVSELILII